MAQRLVGWYGLRVTSALFVRLMLLFGAVEGAREDQPAAIITTQVLWICRHGHGIILEYLSMLVGFQVSLVQFPHHFEVRVADPIAVLFCHARSKNLRC